MMFISPLRADQKTSTGELVSPEAGSFFVDPVSGDDSRDGRSPDSAWKTWNSFRSQALPGASLLLKRGCTFSLPLPLHGGAPGVPIRYGAYDSIDIAHGLAPIDVFIEHNTCWNAGEGWALQGESRPRYSLHIPDQLGYHLNFEILDNPWDEQTSVTVRNNIFANAPAGRCFNFGPQPPTAADFQRFKINHNCYFQANSADTLVQFGSRRFEPKRFGSAQFAAYQQESSWDTNSIVANPQFINPEGGDFRLSPDSPATGMGVRSGAAISK